MNLHRPLFVIGSPRSGTSLLRLVLTSHPQLVVPPECGFILWLREGFGAWQAADSAQPARVDAFLDALLACRKFDTWQMDRATLRAHLLAQPAADYAGLCARVYQAYALAQGREVAVWGDKNNFHIQHMAELAALYPEARFLHIVRDGRDVACSYREVMQAGSDSPYAPRFDTRIGAIAAEWSANVLQAEACRAALPAHRSLLLRYEDLVGAPAEAVQRLCAWLGLPVDAGMLNFHEANRSRQLEPAATLDWKRRTLEPISDSTVGRYRSSLSEADLAAFTALAGEALQRFGYLEATALA